jgi:hypothetical protein
VAYSSIPARIKSLERLASTNGPVIAIFLPSDDASARDAKERILDEAKARRRETIRVDLRFPITQRIGAALDDELCGDEGEHG